MKILVVENPPVLEIIADQLTSAGHSVVTASNAMEASRIYDPKGFDFVLCGLTLDGQTTGMELMDKILTINENQRHGFVTGHTIQYDSILRKPFSKQQLLDFVEKRGPDDPRVSKLTGLPSFQASRKRRAVRSSRWSMSTA